MKIAIVRLSSLGDIVKNASVLQFIKKHYPNSEITWIVDSKFGDILDESPYLDNIIKIDLKWLKKNLSFKNIKIELSKLPNSYFDIVIDSHGMLKSALISKYIAKNKIYGFDGIIKEKISKIFYTKSFLFRCDENEVYRYNKLVANALGYKFDFEDIYKIKPFLGYKNCKKEQIDIVLAFGASKGWEAKKYPIEKWINIINSLEYQFYLLWGSEEEKKEAEYIASKTSAKIAPKMDLNQLKCFISSSKLLVGNDTGPSHIAWALGIKSIILFGCTDKTAMVEDKNHIAIKSNSIVNHCKFDKSDLSIQEIDENLIIKKIKELI